jgi:hypothetical protein
MRGKSSWTHRASAANLSDALPDCRFTLNVPMVVGLIALLGPPPCGLDRHLGLCRTHASAAPGPEAMVRSLRMSGRRFLALHLTLLATDRIRQRQAALGHHFHQVSQTPFEPQKPAYAQGDEFAVEVATRKHPPMVFSLPIATLNRFGAPV